MDTYHGQADIARWCKVTSAAVSNWINRDDAAYPAPDAIITNEGTETVIRGWLPERRPEWEAFAASHKPTGHATPSRINRAADLIAEAAEAGRIPADEAVRLIRGLLGGPSAPASPVLQHPDTAEPDDLPGADYEITP